MGIFEYLLISFLSICVPYFIYFSILALFDTDPDHKCEKIANLMGLIIVVVCVIALAIHNILLV
jgi:hypothetical protein